MGQLVKNSGHLSSKSTYNEKNPKNRLHFPHGLVIIPLVYPDLAKFGIALDLGSRDRGFESRSPDQNKGYPIQGSLYFIWQGIRKTDTSPQTGAKSVRWTLFRSWENPAVRTKKQRRYFPSLLFSYFALLTRKLGWDIIRKKNVIEWNQLSAEDVGSFLLLRIVV